MEKSIDGLRFDYVTATGELGFICDRVNNLKLKQVRVSAVRGGPYAFSLVAGLELAHITPPGRPVGQLAAPLSDSLTAQPTADLPAAGN
jgi:hypothetical protein